MRAGSRTVMTAPVSGHASSHATGSGSSASVGHPPVTACAAPPATNQSRVRSSRQTSQFVRSASKRR
jgi:hypothetical protein